MAYIDPSFEKLIEVSSCKKIISLCEPLQLLHLDYFLYSKNFHNGKHLFLTNTPDWNRYFFESDLYKEEAQYIKPQYDSEGIFVWSSLKHQEFFKHLEVFNIGKGVTIVDRSKYYTEYWYFGMSMGESESGINDFINNLDLVRRFMGYFKSNSLDVIAKMNHMIPTCDLVELPSPQHLFTNDTKESMREKFFSLTDSNRYYLNLDGQESYLTKKEMVCLTYLKDGLSAGEISDVLDVSKRTIETHIEHIKVKIGCTKQFQLGYLLSKCFVI